MEPQSASPSFNIATPPKTPEEIELSNRITAAIKNAVEVIPKVGDEVSKPTEPQSPFVAVPERELQTTAFAGESLRMHTFGAEVGTMLANTKPAYSGPTSFNTNVILGENSIAGREPATAETPVEVAPLPALDELPKEPQDTLPADFQQTAPLTQFQKTLPPSELADKVPLLEEDIYSDPTPRMITTDTIKGAALVERINDVAKSFDLGEPIAVTPHTELPADDEITTVEQSGATGDFLDTMSLGEAQKNAFQNTIRLDDTGPATIPLSQRDRDAFEGKSVPEIPKKMKGGLFSKLQKAASGFVTRLVERKNDALTEKYLKATEDTRPPITSPEEKQRVLEAVKRAEESLLKVDNKTEERRLTLLEKANGMRKKLLEKVTMIGEGFNAIPLKYKLVTGLSISALAATGGAPVLMPALALTIAFRAASGAGTYAALQIIIRNHYKKAEDRGEKVSFLKKGILESTALGVAAFGGYYLGQAIGSLFEGAQTLVNENVKEVLPSPIVTPDVTPPSPVTEVPAPSVVELAPPMIDPSMIHIIGPNERLWDIVKDHLFAIDHTDTFKNLPLEAKNLEISKYIAFIDQEKLVSDINKLEAGKVLDFSKIDGKVPVDILKHVNPFK